MPIDVFKKVLYTDGEGLDYTDANAAQDYIRAQVFDLGFGGMARRFEEDVSLDATVCYAFGAGGYARPGASRTVRSTKGTIAQYVGGGTPDGQSQTLLTYYLGNDEINVTIPSTSGMAGGTVRVDGIFIKLTELDGPLVTRDFEDAATLAKTSSNSFVGTRRVVLSTPLYVTGTARAATTWTDYASLMPATPAGYVPWAAVYVPKAAADGNDVDGSNAPWYDSTVNSSIFDMRMPIGKAERRAVLPNEMWYAAADWTTRTYAFNDITAVGAGKVVEVFMPAGAFANGRLVGFGIKFAGTLPTISLRAYSNSEAIVPKILADGITVSHLSASDGSALPPAIWCNGQSLGPGATFYVTTGMNRSLSLYLTSADATTRIYGAWFEVVG